MILQGSLFLVLLVGLATPFLAWANFSNYSSIVIGDQASGMGGAATAMTTDSSGAAWYNPATLAKLPGQSLSASVGIYKKFDTRYRENSDLTEATFKANQGFFRALPSSTASVIRPKQISWLRDYTLALSILVPEFEQFKGDIFKQGESLSSLNLTVESLWVGGAIAKRVSRRESMGLSLYYTARSYTRSVVDRTYIDSSQYSVFSEDRNLTQNGVVMQLGYHYDWTKNWKLGLMFRPSGLSVAGRADVEQTTLTNGNLTTPTSERGMGTKARIPPAARIGVAYVSPRRFSWSFDLSYHGAMSYGDVDRENLAERIEHRPTWNAATGIEIYWSDWLRSRAGLFSNYSSHPDPNPELVRGQGDHVDQAGFSANLVFVSGPIRYTFGGYYVGGRGRSVQRVNQNFEVVTKVQNVFTMLVATSYQF